MRIRLAVSLDSRAYKDRGQNERSRLLGPGIGIMGAEMSTEERLTNLESKLAYQDDTLDALNAVVTQQQEEISRLQAMCKYLNQRLNEFESPDPRASADDEKPPHY